MAAGGVVWRTVRGLRTLAVIHRPKYDDWTLPKGKPLPGEPPADTALREVREELGVAATFLDFAGTVHYPVGEAQTKVVLFWNMKARGPSGFSPNAEVDDVLWLTLPQAIRKLSHRVEKQLLRSLYQPASGPPRRPPAAAASPPESPAP